MQANYCYKNTQQLICEPVQDKTEKACASSSVWLDSAYEEALYPCLPIKRIAKTLIRLGGSTRFGFVRSMIFGLVRGCIARGWKISMYSFQRWASDDFGPIESCMVQKAPIHVGSTDHVFALYWSARLAVGCSKAPTASARARTASKQAPSETSGVHVRVGQMLNNRVWLGKYNLSMHSFATPDPERLVRC